MLYSQYYKNRRNYISRSGDSVDVKVRLAWDPIADDEAATKGYVDNILTPGDAIIRPATVGRYYVGQFYSSVVSVFGDAGRVYCMLLYAGGTTTWDRLVVCTNTNHASSPRGTYEWGLFEIDDAGPPYGKDPWVWKSGEIAFPQNNDLYIEHTLDPAIQTTTNLLGIAAWRSHTPLEFAWINSTGGSVPFGVQKTRWSTRIGADMLISFGTNTSGGLSNWNPSDLRECDRLQFGAGAPRAALRLASIP